MAELDGFVEVTNELPFKKIKNIKIESVTLQGDKFKIKCKCQIQGSINDKQMLSRSGEDINWLIDNIASNKKTYLSPKINAQTYLSMVYQKISTATPAKMEFQKKLTEKMVQRALSIITTLILEHLKGLGDQYVYPIFIFFHENFNLYKNPIYYKEQATPLAKKMGNYLWQTIGKISNKAVGWQQLKKCKESINKEMGQYEQARSKLADYTSSLMKLQEQFIGEKEKIKNQVNLVEKLLLAYENQVKYLSLVEEEIKQTLIKIEDRSLVEDLMKQYALLLMSEVERSKDVGKKLIKEYVLVMCHNEQRIKISPC